jgi:hypothetical protein
MEVRVTIKDASTLDYQPGETFIINKFAEREVI